MRETSLFCRVSDSRQSYCCCSIYIRRPPTAFSRKKRGAFKNKRRPFKTTTVIGAYFQDSKLLDVRSPIPSYKLFMKYLSITRVKSRDLIENRANNFSKKVQNILKNSNRLNFLTGKSYLSSHFKERGFSLVVRLVKI